VPTSGQFSGHCAFVSLVRSSGAELEPAAELRVVMTLRALAVVDTCARLAADPGFDAVLAAAADVQLHGTGGVGASVGSKRRRADSPSAAGAAAGGSAVGGGPTLPAGITAYLRGMLSARPTSASQYAGALEFAALARQLRRRIVVLVEADDHVDHGGVFPDGDAGDLLHAAEGAGAAAGAGFHPLPLVMVNTRRQHTFPVVVQPLAAAAASSSAASGSGAMLAPLELGGVLDAVAAAEAEFASLVAPAAPLCKVHKGKGKSKAAATTPAHDNERIAHLRALVSEAGKIARG
jgi:hypothetical protein